MDHADLLRMKRYLRDAETAIGGAAPVDAVCGMIRERINRVAARLKAEDEKRRLDDAEEIETA